MIWGAFGGENPLRTRSPMLRTVACSRSGSVMLALRGASEAGRRCGRG